MNPCAAAAVPPPPEQHGIRLARRCSAVVLLLIMLVGCAGVLLGAQPLQPQLRESWRALDSAWGPMLARQWVAGVLALASAGGVSGVSASATWADTLSSLPMVGAVLGACRRTPVALIGHLLALAGWLVLLLPLALAVVCCVRIPHGSAAGALRGRRVGAWLLPAVLLWLPTPLATAVWAPLVAALCLSACLGWSRSSIIGWTRVGRRGASTARSTPGAFGSGR